ncbi:MAG: DUF58 domain-containing protein [Gemmatimonadetes bacterium]|nr:DUF58 domain-containing protein [Gemmatimonadota bacterium]
MTTSARATGTEFLDPAILTRIGNLEFIAKAVVEGFINGLHRSPHLGSSTDFAEHRQYMPGDDIRRIDWRVFARSDRFYVKEFEADTNANFLAIVDVSPSMRYKGSTAPISKLEYACFLAAALAYFSSGQRDRVGLATFDHDITDYIPPSAKHLRQVLHALDRAFRAGAVHSPDEASVAASGFTEPKSPNPAARASMLPAMKKLSESVRRRSIVLMISDLYEDPKAVFDSLDHLRGRGNDLICFHLLDRDEMDFPFAESGRFVDIETGEVLPLIPEFLRKQYRALIESHTGELARLARERRIDYARFDTSRPLSDALYAYLGAREHFNRVR